MSAAAASLSQPPAGAPAGLSLAPLRSPAIGGPCAGGALVAWLFVSDKPSVAPRLAVPDRGCALPVLDQEGRP